MKLQLFLFTIGLIACHQARATVVNNGRKIYCTGASITEVRIEGCDAEPCSIPKGTNVPFQIDMTFEVPEQSSDIAVRVFNSYWGAPGEGSFGSYIVEASGCEALQTSECPLHAGTAYTLSSNIYIDPESVDSLSGAETGSRGTSWTLNVSGADREEHSTCVFDVKIQIEAAA